MPTFKLELYKSKTLSDGRHPVCLRVTHGRQVRKTIASASVDEWDSKNLRIKPRSRRDYARVNSDIEDEYNKYEAVFLALKKGNRAWLPEDVFADNRIVSPYFLENSLDYIKYLEGKAAFSYAGANAIHNKIADYVNKRDFVIDDITLKWLNGFRNHLKSEYSNAENTILLAIKYIKRVVKYAGAENRVLRDTHISYDETLKPKLTLQEVENIDNLSFTPGTLIYHTQKTFLLQIYLWGMRIGDLLLLKQTDVKGRRLVYTTSKTRKMRDIAIADKAYALLSEYLDESKEYLLPWIRWQPDEELSDFENKRHLNFEMKNRTVVINKHLKTIAEKAEITKNVSTHTARHTFARLGDKRLDGNLEILQQMLGHSSRAMTERYVNDLRKSDLLDDAADKIFGV